MGIQNAAGNRLNQAGVPTTDPADPERVLGIDVYQTVPWGPGDGTPSGSVRKRLASAGDVVRQSQIDAWFPDPTVASLSPTDGAAAGGTEVTIAGENLDGVTGVTFDGVAATNLTIDSATQIRVTTPAGTAGPADVVVTDDGGTATVSGGYTYA